MDIVKSLTFVMFQKKKRNNSFLNISKGFILFSLNYVSDLDDGYFLFCII